MQPRTFPQVKICGLTDADEAAACAALGADAIGLVFYPPSPRHVSVARAARIVAALPPGVTAVGVFVDPAPALLADIIVRCRLGAVQLHGAESQVLIDRLRNGFNGLILKALFAAKAPRLVDAGRYHGAAFLVECGRGSQPGGNALAWEWGAVADFARRHPILLAGGLDPDNVGRAIAAARPDGVDVSSGVEAAPGRKDLDRVARFVDAVRQSGALYEAEGLPLRRVF